MIGKIGVAALFVLASAAPALADECGSAPIPPEITVDGATAPKQDLLDAIKDFKTYQSQADGYVACLEADLKKQADVAKNAKDPKPLDPAIISAARGKEDQIQADKEKVGGQLNAQIIAYKQAHPSK